MSDYSRNYDFSAKDLLSTGDPLKKIKGSEVDEEFDDIVTAIASKLEAVGSATAGNVATLTSGGALQDGGTLLAALATLASPALTGTPTTPTAGAGTNTTQIASTAFVQQEIGSLEASSEVQLSATMTADLTANAAHGLSAEPDLICLILECTTIDNGYQVGDRINLTGSGNDAGGTAAFSAWADATNVYVAFDDRPRLAVKAGGGSFRPTASSWKLVYKAVVF